MQNLIVWIIGKIMPQLLVNSPPQNKQWVCGLLPETDLHTAGLTHCVRLYTYNHAFKFRKVSLKKIID